VRQLGEQHAHDENEKRSELRGYTRTGTGTGNGNEKPKRSRLLPRIVFSAGAVPCA
jgi:hypothetical protein